MLVVRALINKDWLTKILLEAFEGTILTSQVVPDALNKSVKVWLEKL